MFIWFGTVFFVNRFNSLYNGLVTPNGVVELVIILFGAKLNQWLHIVNCILNSIQMLAYCSEILYSCWSRIHTVVTIQYCVYLSFTGDWWNLINSDYLFLKYIDGLLQDCSISGALGMKILLFCTKPSIYASGNYTGSTHHSNLVVAGYLTRWSDKMRVKICVAECF